MRCPYLSNYLCSFAEECRRKGPPEFCAYHVLQRDKYKPLLEDSEEEGYYLYGVEYAINLLNERNYPVRYKNSKSTRDSQDLKFWPSPRKLDEIVDVDIGASSLAKCPAEIILSKYVAPPEERKRLFEVGSLMHEIFNKDFGPNYRNMHELRLLKISRKEYCEIPVAYEIEGIKIGGRIDCLLSTEFEGKEIPAIVDLKRSRYGGYKKRYLIQLGTYKLALKAEEALLITIKRNRYGYPKPTINFVDAEFDEELKDYIKRKFEGIASVLTHGPMKGTQCEGCDFKNICRKFDF